jgi:hypothetical protein
MAPSRAPCHPAIMKSSILTQNRGKNPQWLAVPCGCVHERGIHRDHHGECLDPDCLCQGFSADGDFLPASTELEDLFVVLD